MATINIKELQEQNRIEEHEWNSIISILLKPLLNINIMHSQDLLLQLSSFIDKYLELHLEHNKEEKLRLIQFIDKLNLQIELSSLAKKEIEMGNIEIAGKRLGKKSQSSFNGS